MSRFTNAANTLFAKATIKEVTLIHDVSEAVTFVETLMPDGTLRRHQMRVILNTRMVPSQGQIQVALWKFVKKMVDVNNLGELKYVRFNNTLYSVNGN